MKHSLVFLLLWLSFLGAVGAHGSDSSNVPRLVASPEAGWPQFRGPYKDGISRETGLLKKWPEEGPRLLWTARELGNGYSSPIIGGERIFITGDVGDEVHLFAMDLAGHLLWKATNGASWKNPYPGARSSITYFGGAIFHLNGHGRLASYAATDGKELWSVNILQTYGGKNITWGLSECLIVDDRAVYVTAGGEKALVVALDRKTGKEKWKSAPLHDSEGAKAVENPSYVSPIQVEFAGRKLLIGCSIQHLYVVDCEDGKIHSVQRLPTTYQVLAMTPQLIGKGIFMTAPHGKGGKLWRLTPPNPSGGHIGMVEEWSSKLDTCQGAVVEKHGKIFGSFYSSRKGWAALDASTGNLLYELPEFKKGAPLLGDDRIYALCEDGWMVLLRPEADRFEVDGKFRVAEASSNDAWAHPVLFNKRLYLRYHGNLFCYDVGAKD